MSDSTPSIAPPRSARPQLTLWQLLVLMTLIGIAIGSHLWFQWFGAAIWGTALWFVASYYGWLKRGWVEAVFALLLIAIILLPPMIYARNVREGYTRTGQCNSQLRQVGIALQMYHLQHGEYPPIATYSKAGRPMHSWRTYILTHIEREDLAEAYDFAEPWDGPTNSVLHGQKIRLFSCPSDPGQTARQVSYLALIDSRAKPGEPFAVIEVHNSGVNYFEPRDVTIAELLSPQSPLARGRRPHPGDTFNLLQRNGSTRRVTLEELREILLADATERKR